MASTDCAACWRGRSSIRTCRSSTRSGRRPPNSATSTTSRVWQQPPTRSSTWWIKGGRSASTSSARCSARPRPWRDRETEKARIRRQEHLRRDAQLRQPSVRRFVDSMERTHQHGDRLVSIFNLMRDGRELAAALEDDPDPSDTIQPYVQVVDSSSHVRTDRLQTSRHLALLPPYLVQRLLNRARAFDAHPDPRRCH